MKPIIEGRESKRRANEVLYGLARMQDTALAARLWQMWSEEVHAVATPTPEAPTEPERAGTGSIEGDRTAFHQMFSILERH